MRANVTLLLLSIAWLALAATPSLAQGFDEFPCDALWSTDACDGCGASSPFASRFAFATRGGIDYFDVPGEVETGGLYGGDMGLRLTDNWGLLGSLNVTHVSGGTMVVGTGGLFRLADFSTGSASDRVTAAVLFDQFTDTRITDLYLNQLRLQLGYALTEQWESGVVYTRPTNLDDDVTFLLTAFGNFPLPGRLQQSESVSAYVAGNLKGTVVSAQLGYRDGVNSVTLGSSASVPITDRVWLSSAVNYDAEPGSWGVTCGLELGLGGGGGGPRVRIARAQPAERGIVRAQSPEAEIIQVQKTEESDGPASDSFSLDDFAPPPFVTSPPAVVMPLIPDWPDRFFDAPSLDVLRVTPGQFWRTTDFQNFTDPAQNIQFQFGRVILESGRRVSPR